ncbi:hypothetical protein K440DRAFT_658307 [Wilcoxina mikolae CBS 423.85]|nr:hypothetical protein K440DRAFT_658307 [Wilcoxina mikolae CBS 423.85]
MPARDVPKRWAILIGIDTYPYDNARRDPDVRYTTLRGCVRDIIAVYHYLLTVLYVDKNSIWKLTASAHSDTYHDGPDEEDSNTTPTYENMIRAFKSVTDAANAGDLVYIHYSGYGARVGTIFPDLKGSGGIDEALVCTDVCTGGRYLRDIELGNLLYKMVRKQLVVTVVLDCCYSGIAAISHGSLCRGIAKIDTTVLPSDKAPGLAHGVFPSCRDRNVSKNQSWLLRLEGYEIYTACRQNEQAYEAHYPDTGGYHGTFTYWMLNILKAEGNITHRMLYQKILDSIQNRHSRTASGEPQIPVFAGNPDRYFFQSETTQEISTLAPTLSVDMATTDQHSKALFSRQSSPQCQNMMSALYRQWTLIHVTRYKGYGNHQLEALDRIEKVDWKKFSYGIAPLQLVRSNCFSIGDSGEGNQNGFSVMIDEGGGYELWTGDGASMKPIPHFTRFRNPDVFLSRVAQLAKYGIVKNLKSPNHTPLTGKFSFRVKDDRFDSSIETAVEVEDGDEITIIFKNNSDRPVNLTILDLQPLYGISQIYPEVMNCEEVDAGEERELQFEFARPPGITTGTLIDTIKAFITLDGTSFKDFEMDDITINPDSEVAVERRVDMGFQSLVNHLMSANRSERVQSSGAGLWETMEISVHVRGSENIDGEDITAQKVVKCLSTVIATGRGDIFILPPPHYTILDKAKEAVETVLNLRVSQCVRTNRENQRSPAQRNVMWRCRCGKIFTGVIPLELADSYQSYQSTRATVHPSGQYLPSHKNLAIQGTSDWDTYDASLVRGDFVYLCVQTGGRLAESAYVVLPSPAEGRYDDEFFRRLRKTYSDIRGVRNIRHVTSIKFVKFQHSHRHYVSCYEQEELPPMNEGYSYEFASSPALRQDELIHFFNSPQCMQGSTACLRRIPKKVGGFGEVYGWGLHLQESTSIASILLPFIISVLGLFTAYAAFYYQLPFYDTVLRRWGVWF